MTLDPSLTGEEKALHRISVIVFINVYVVITTRLDDHSSKCLILTSYSV